MKSQVSWTKEEEEILAEQGPKLMIHELLQILPRHTEKAISTKRRRLGIKLPKELISKLTSYHGSQRDFDLYCKLNQTWKLYDLTNEEFQVLIGCQLGDGCITKCGSGAGKQRNFIFRCSHVEPQLDYVDWKMQILSRFQPRKSLGLDKKTNHKRSEFSTLSHPIFTELRDKFYELRYRCNKGIIPLDLIEKLDLFGLMIWYLDDGYLGVCKSGTINNARKKDGPKCRKKPFPFISAKGYSYDDLTRVCEIFNKKYGLSLCVKTSKHRGGQNKVISIPAGDRSKVLGEWRKLAIIHRIPECMYYKLNMHDAELLDWELSENVRKLGREDVIEIRKLCSNGESQRKVAKKFNICPESIRRIMIGKSYKDFV